MMMIWMYWSDSFAAVVNSCVSLRFRFYERKKERIERKKHAFRFLGKHVAVFYLYICCTITEIQQRTERSKEENTSYNAINAKMSAHEMMGPWLLYRVLM